MPTARARVAPDFAADEDTRGERDELTALGCPPEGAIVAASTDKGGSSDEPVRPGREWFHADMVDGSALPPLAVAQELWISP